MDELKKFVTDNAAYLISGAIGVVGSAVYSVVSGKRRAKKGREALELLEKEEAAAKEAVTGEKVVAEVVDNVTPIDPTSAKIAEIQKAANEAIAAVKSAVTPAPAPVNDTVKPVQFTTVKG